MTKHLNKNPDPASALAGFDFNSYIRPGPAPTGFEQSNPIHPIAKWLT